ncbi:MAG: DUF3368 domain-containing protein [Gammaproteobacteria bacterium]|jgi:hypothetical protein|nr:DUF3368 domain-containing protein [Gammaproteobacteria bacterium]
MQLLISDANILIDMQVSGMLASMFQLTYRFAVPDILFAEELAQHHPELPASGLNVLPLAAAAIADAVSLLDKYRGTGVSRNDIFAIAPARQEACPLLTGDKNLRMVAATEGTEVHGTLWLVEQMVLNRIAAPADAQAAYEAMRDEGRRLPWGKVERQLSKFVDPDSAG